MRGDIEKRLSKLEQRSWSAKRRPIVTLVVNHGEDEQLIEAAWRAEHPSEGEPENFVLLSVFGEPPREGFATRRSVLEVLPQVKAFAEQSPDVDVDSWRAWAVAAGLDYDAIEPDRPYSDLTNEPRRPYQPPQDRAPGAQSSDLGLPYTHAYPLDYPSRAPTGEANG